MYENSVFMVHVQCAAYLCHDLGFQISLIQCENFE